MKPVRFRPLIAPLMAALTLLPVLAPAADAAPDNSRIPVLGATDIPGRCEQGLADLRARVAALEAPLPTNIVQDDRKVLHDWNDLHVALEDLEGPISLLNHVSPDAAVRKNAEPCLVSITQFSTDLFQNEKLYKKIQSVAPLDAIEKKLRQDILDGFDDTGISLPADKQKRMKEILSQLTKLKQEYARNVRDNNQKLAFSAKEMKGLPQDFIDKAKRDETGNYLLGFEYTDYLPFMQYADSSEARKRYQFAFTNRGTPKNLQLMKEAVALRHEMAALFGYKNYAEYALRRHMAGKPEAVNKFLNEVHQAVDRLERQELDELSAFKVKTAGAGSEEEKKIQRWDVAYWQEKMKQSLYNIDQNALRKYFPTQASVQWVMAMSGTLYGVQFKSAEATVWHQDVKYYEVYDSKSLKRIGAIYLDLFPREGKYGHAAAFGVRGSSTMAQRAPISVLVANFNREGLDANEVETLWHEFGHVLHGVLSKTRFVDHAGTSVERDFVEAPSQMYEEWARNSEALAMLPQYCSTPCPPVDNDLLLRLKAANHFARGTRYARQHLYASYDMALHQTPGSDPLALWQKMEGATALGHVAGTEFPGQFGHLMGGYAAGYYGYMWSEVIALDMLSRYDGKLMNPEVGRKYRESILERGSELRGSELVRNFLGRDPDSKAFFNEIGGKPKK